MLLDKRIHRSVKLGVNFSTSEAYTLVVTASGNKNILTLTDTSTGNPLESIACANIFTPPNCGTPIDTIHNANCQGEAKPKNPSDTIAMFRIFELHQELNTSGYPLFIVRITNSSGTPDDGDHTLHYTASSTSAETVIPLDVKIPPKLG